MKRCLKSFAFLYVVSVVGLAAATAAQTVNGCAFASAQAAYDVAADRSISNLGFTYSPACIVIRESQSVEWSMPFLTHPLNPGEVVGGVPQPADPANPITLTNSGDSVSFQFPDAGTHPFYCGNHFPSGMFGAIFVALFADGFEDADLCDWSTVAPAETCP